MPKMYTKSKKSQTTLLLMFYATCWQHCMTTPIDDRMGTEVLEELTTTTPTSSANRVARSGRIRIANHTKTTNFSLPNGFRPPLVPANPMQYPAATSMEYSSNGWTPVTYTATENLEKHATMATTKSRISNYEKTAQMPPVSIGKIIPIQRRIDEQEFEELNPVILEAMSEPIIYGIPMTQNEQVVSTDDAKQDVRKYQMSHVTRQVYYSDPVTLAMDDKQNDFRSQDMERKLEFMKEQIERLGQRYRIHKEANSEKQDINNSTRKQQQMGGHLRIKKPTIPEIKKVNATKALDEYVVTQNNINDTALNKKYTTITDILYKETSTMLPTTSTVATSTTTLLVSSTQPSQPEEALITRTTHTKEVTTSKPKKETTWPLTSSEETAIAREYYSEEVPPLEVETATNSFVGDDIELPPNESVSESVVDLEPPLLAAVLNTTNAAATTTAEPTICVPMLLRERSANNTAGYVDLERIYCFPMPPEMQTVLHSNENDIIDDGPTEVAKVQILTEEFTNEGIYSKSSIFGHNVVLIAWNTILAMAISCWY